MLYANHCNSCTTNVQTQYMQPTTHTWRELTKTVISFHDEGCFNLYLPKSRKHASKVTVKICLFLSPIHNFLLFFFFLVFIWVIWFHCWEKQDLLKAEWTNTMLNSLYMQQLHALIHQAISHLPICTLLHVILQSQAQWEQNSIKWGKRWMWLVQISTFLDTLTCMNVFNWS